MLNLDGSSDNRQRYNANIEHHVSYEFSETMSLVSDRYERKIRKYLSPACLSVNYIWLKDFFSILAVTHTNALSRILTFLFSNVNILEISKSLFRPADKNRIRLQSYKKVNTHLFSYITKILRRKKRNPPSPFAVIIEFSIVGKIYNRRRARYRGEIPLLL